MENKPAGTFASALRGWKTDIDVIIMVNIFSPLPDIHSINAVIKICLNGDHAISMAFCVKKNPAKSETIAHESK